MKIEALFANETAQRASDLHLRVGVRPRYRVDGQLIEHPDNKVTTDEMLQNLINQLLNKEQQEWFAEKREVDLSLSVPDVGRLRCNCFMDQAGPALAIRRLPEAIPSFSELHLPASIEALSHLKSGLVLITIGPCDTPMRPLCWATLKTRR